MRSPIRTSVVLCLVVALGLMAACATPGGDDPVVPPGGALPTRLHDVDRDLHGTDEVGPIGPLAVAWTAGKGRMIGGIPLFRPLYEQGVVGVSAETGAYAFLDIPMEPGTYRCGFVELSPDGRRMAFWISRVSRPWAPWACDDASALGVYDTVTGEVVRQSITPGESVAWIDSDRLVIGHFGSLRPRTDDLRAAPFRVWDVRRPAAAHRDGLPRPLRGVRLPLRSVDGVAIDDTSTRAVRVRNDRGPLLVSSWDNRLGEENLRVPGPEDYVAVVGWRDEGSVVALTQTADGAPRSLVATEIETGRREVLTRIDGTSSDPISFAGDLLSVPPVPRPAPRASGWFHSPFAVAGLSLAMILLVGTALLAAAARRRRAGAN
ncbi:putative peptide chain release factor 2 (RF-2) [Nocardioidaceae bacterium Broad-1]|nr:putative peptide chain release factor 2 (RF-2) [Nocardioidaceae bacterium Broad-1]